MKFCRVAEGSIDLYPRLAPTHEWDVAAGHAILAAAGGTVVTPSAAPLAYGRFADELRVPGFVAFGDPRAVKAILSQEDCIDPYQAKLADLGSKE